MTQKVISTFLAVTQSKSMRPALTVFALLVAVLAVTGCKHPH